MIKSCDHQNSSLFFEKADVCVRIVSGTSVDSVFRVRVRTSCLRCGLGESVGLRVYGLGSPRVVGVAAQGDPLGSSIVEILRVSKAGM